MLLESGSIDDWTSPKGFPGVPSESATDTEGSVDACTDTAAAWDSSAGAAAKGLPGAPGGNTGAGAASSAPSLNGSPAAAVGGAVSASLKGLPGVASAAEGPVGSFDTALTSPMDVGRPASGPTLSFSAATASLGLRASAVKAASLLGGASSVESRLGIA